MYKIYGDKYMSETNRFTKEMIDAIDKEIESIKMLKELAMNELNSCHDKEISRVKTLLSQRKMYENTLNEDKLSEASREMINEELNKTNKEIENLFSNVDSICNDVKKENKKDYLEFINTKKFVDSTFDIVKNNLFLVHLPKEMEISDYSIERVDFVPDDTSIRITVREITGKELINAVKNIGKEFDNITIDVLDISGVIKYTNIFSNVRLLNNIKEDSFDYSYDNIHKFVLTFDYKKREFNATNKK